MRFLISLLVLLTLPACGQLRRASSGEIDMGKKALASIPNPANIAKREFQFPQVMVLHENTILFPVRFETTSASPFFECGLAFVPVHGTPTLLLTFGMGQTEPESCGEARAIGTTSPGEHPDLALIYTGSVNNHSVTEAIPLRWSGSSYIVDDDTYTYLSTHLRQFTIAAVRKTLRTRTGTRRP